MDCHDSTGVVTLKVNRICTPDDEKIFRKEDGNVPGMLWVDADTVKLPEGISKPLFLAIDDICAMMDR